MVRWHFLRPLQMVSTKEKANDTGPSLPSPPALQLASPHSCPQLSLWLLHGSHESRWTWMSVKMPPIPTGIRQDSGAPTEHGTPRHFLPRDPAPGLSTKACVFLPLAAISFSLDIWCRSGGSDPIKRGRNREIFLNKAEIHSQNEFPVLKHLHLQL